jgi:hypothetical protein
MKKEDKVLRYKRNYFTLNFKWFSDWIYNQRAHSKMANFKLHNLVQEKRFYLSVCIENQKLASES